VCFRVGKAPTRRNLDAASLISFVMVAEVSSINAFRTRTNSSGMIEDEELSFREWNCFEHVGTSTGRKPYLCALVEMAQWWKSRAGRKPYICTTQSGRPYPMHRGSRGEEKPLTCAFCLKLTAPRENVGGSIQRYFCGPFRLFSRIFVHVLHRHRCGRRELDQHFRSSCHILSHLYISLARA
jgi:hypothetical protein